MAHLCMESAVLNFQSVYWKLKTKLYFFKTLKELDHYFVVKNHYHLTYLELSDNEFFASYMVLRNISVKQFWEKYSKKYFLSIFLQGKNIEAGNLKTVLRLQFLLFVWNNFCGTKICTYLSSFWYTFLTEFKFGNFCWHKKFWILRDTQKFLSMI